MSIRFPCHDLTFCGYCLSAQAMTLSGQTSFFKVFLWLYVIYSSCVKSLLLPLHMSTACSVVSIFNPCCYSISLISYYHYLFCSIIQTLLHSLYHLHPLQLHLHLYLHLHLVSCVPTVQHLRMQEVFGTMHMVPASINVPIKNWL